MGYGIIAWLVIGAIAGWLAGKIVEGGGFGLIVDIIVGIVGAVIGGFLAGVLGISIGGSIIGSIIVAVIGAVIAAPGRRRNATSASRVACDWNSPTSQLPSSLRRSIIPAQR